MGLFKKIGLLFKIQKPLGELAKLAPGVKTGYKTIAFWITFVGTLLSTAGALTGVIPPQVMLIITTILQALYNILRGAQKMDSSDTKGLFTTTEFFTSALGEIQKGLVASQLGGINPEWMASATTIVGMALAAGQNLASRTPPEGAKK